MNVASNVLNPDARAKLINIISAGGNKEFSELCKKLGVSGPTLLKAVVGLPVMSAVCQVLEASTEKVKGKKK